MKRKIVSIAVALTLLVSMLSITVTGLASASGTIAPTVSKTASPTDINIAGSGVNEETTVTITVTGAGGTSTTITPMDVVFALDSSGSMGWNDPSDLRKTAAKSFVDKMDDTRDTAGVVSWDDNIDFTYGLSSDFPTVKLQIDNVDSSGGTDLNVGLNAAIAMLDANTRVDPSAEVIIFLTDGIGTYTYSGDPGAPADDAASKGYVIYSIGLSDDADMGPLDDMAAATGGQSYTSPSASNLQAIFDAIYEEVVTSTIPYNVDVVEVTQSYIVEEGSFNIPPDSVSTVGGITTIRWNNIGVINDGDPDMSADETVVLTFQAKSSQSGSNLDVEVTGSAKVDYDDNDGNYVGSVPIPQAKINVNAPPVAVCQDITLPLDANGQATLTASQVDGGSYDPDGDPITLSIDKTMFDCSDIGPNTVTLTVTDDKGLSAICTATVTVVDITPPKVKCIESVNPHGKKIPPAGSSTLPGAKGGQNEDGFYQLFAEDSCDSDPDIFVSSFGPFKSGDVVKITEAPGATPSMKKIGSSNGQAGAVVAHLILDSDPCVTAVDTAGNTSQCTDCLVPPPPK